MDILTSCPGLEFFAFLDVSCGRLKTNGEMEVVVGVCLDGGV